MFSRHFTFGRFLLLIGILSSFNMEHLTAQPVNASSLTGKVICGYQGWFNCFGDGSPVMSWRHWSPGVYQSNAHKPTPGNVTFEVYPDVTAYAPNQLFQTGLGPLGDGSPARLFSSYPESVIDLHFSWMEQNGIDGVALQYFITSIFDDVFRVNRDSLAVRVKRQAEAHGRVFYMMYDLSGFPAANFNDLKTNWTNLNNNYHLTDSPAYVHQDGKPVICLWGVGFTHIQGNAAQTQDLINWFKSQGCYVVGGLPTHWRNGVGDSKPDFGSVYQSLDMISPWSVGRFGDIAGADNFRVNQLEPDFAWCNSHNIDYQPVIFPGFAWSNWNGGSRNQIPRDKGNFFWRQAYNIRDQNIPSMYIAMFDEYDEGTAIAPAADSYLKTPVDQYFLTYSADGEYLSSDFYLRLTGKATSMIKNNIPLSASHNVAASAGPVWFRTSLEQNYDAMPTWLNTSAGSGSISGVSGVAPGGIPACAPNTGVAHVGTGAMLIKGTDNSGAVSRAYYKVFDVNIPVSGDTWLRFWTFPENELGRHISVDLAMTDGSTLRDIGAMDINGVSMHPGADRGVIGQWNENVCRIGNWLQGKTIDRILIGYDYAPETGNFSCYVDDITIFNDADAVGTETPAVNVAPTLKLMPNPGTPYNSMVTVDWTAQTDDAILRVYDTFGRLYLEQNLKANTAARINTENWPAGTYFFNAESLNSAQSALWINGR